MIERQKQQKNNFEKITLKIKIKVKEGRMHKEFSILEMDESISEYTKNFIWDEFLIDIDELKKVSKSND